MKSRFLHVALCVSALVALAACDASAPSETPPTAAAPTTTKAPDVSEDESGPESPIAYGLFVPTGATQLGPLFRYRSARLIAAYTPELEAAQAQKDAEAADKVAEDVANGTPSPTPTPTPTTRPSPDTFRLIDDPPRPDTTVSLMRIDGSPTLVVRRVLAQINAALPNANLTLDNLAPYCQSTDRRITRCQASARGLTEGDRDIRITLSVDPGDLATRTSSPANQTKPVMQLVVEYIGDPRAGQLTTETGSLDHIADTDDVPDISGLIWPKMDEDAPLTTPLLNGWTAPSTATLLLTGKRPPFVALTADRALEADEAARQYVQSSSRSSVITKDVAEDLNSISTMYVTRTKDGGLARGVFILSARGNYTALFYTPPVN